MSMHDVERMNVIVFLLIIFMVVFVCKNRIYIH